MGGTLTTHKVLVVGLRDAGKTHLLHMFSYGPDTTKRHTMGFDYATVHATPRDRIDMTECANLRALPVLDKKFANIFLVVDAAATYEELHASRSILLHVLNDYCQHVCVIYNVKPGTRPQYSFKERNNILQVGHLNRRVPTSAIEVQFEDVQGWVQKMSRIFEWIIS